MKKTAKLLGIAAIILLILFSMAACDTSLGNEPIVPASPYLGDKMVFTGSQVYERNQTSYKLSTMHTPYTGADLTVKARIFSAHGYYWEVIGDDGKINNGKFSITVPELTSTQLLVGDRLVGIFVDWNTPPGAIKIMSETNDDLGAEEIGNTVQLAVAPGYDAMLMREGFSGTRTSMSGEVIYYIYVKEDCKIIADEKVIPSVDYTYAAFTLVLKKGWNAVCMKETYTVYGNSTYSAELKNPDLEWTLLQIPSL